jgi:hypothetical protein
MKDLKNRIPCSVTKELVFEVAYSNKDKYIDGNGNIRIAEVLHALGFKVEKGGYYRGYYINENVYVRDNLRPHLVYKTSVYNGEVRNEIIGKELNGDYKYGVRKHKLASAYERLEILQPPVLGKYIAEESFKNIDDIGEVEAYNDGFLAMDKPSSNTTRNIVRN